MRKGDSNPTPHSPSSLTYLPAGPSQPSLEHRSDKELSVVQDDLTISHNYIRTAFLWPEICLMSIQIISFIFSSLIISRIISSLFTSLWTVFMYFFKFLSSLDKTPLVPSKIPREQGCLIPSFFHHLLCKASQQNRDGDGQFLSESNTETNDITLIWTKYFDSKRGGYFWSQGRPPQEISSELSLKRINRYGEGGGAYSENSDNVTNAESQERVRRKADRLKKITKNYATPPFF